MPSISKLRADLDKLRLSLDPSKPHLSAEEKADLTANIQLLRDAIVLFTATGAARGVSGHTGTLIYQISLISSSWVR